jgi:hypothetical protein
MCAVIVPPYYPVRRVSRPYKTWVYRKERLGGIKVSFMGYTLKFFTYYLSQDRFVYGPFPFCKVLSKDFVNHCLVTIPRFIGTCAKVLKNIIVEVNDNTGLALLGENRTSFCFFEVIFLFQRTWGDVLH